MPNHTLCNLTCFYPFFFLSHSLLFSFYWVLSPLFSCPSTYLIIYPQHFPLIFPQNLPSETPVPSARPSSSPASPPSPTTPWLSPAPRVSPGRMSRAPSAPPPSRRKAPVKCSASRRASSAMATTTARTALTKRHAVSSETKEKIAFWLLGLISLVCCNSDITQNFVVLSYFHHPKAQKLLRR